MTINLTTLSSNISVDEINQALNSLDEPYSDPSVVPTYILSKEISQYYKVAISGDGGDELLGGYERTIKSLQKTDSLEIYLKKIYNLYPAILGTGKQASIEFKYLEINTDLS